MAQTPHLTVAAHTGSPFYNKQCTLHSNTFYFTSYTANTLCALETSSDFILHGWHPPIKADIPWDAYSALGARDKYLRLLFFNYLCDNNMVE